MNLPYKTTKEVSKLLREGELVAFPTETVYGPGLMQLMTRLLQKFSR